MGEPDAAPRAGGPAGAGKSGIVCPARRVLATLFGLAAAAAFFAAAWAFLTLVERDELGAAISAAGLLSATGVAMVFAARSCTGFMAGPDGIARLELSGGETRRSWEDVSALVYCVPRAPDAAEGFWFECAGGETFGVPARCAHEVARLALARGTPLKIVRYHQPGMTQALSGAPREAAESYLRARLAGDRAARVPVAPDETQPPSGT